MAVPHTRYVAQLIEPQSGKTLGILETPGSTGLSGYAFSADSRYLAVTDAENIQLWDLSAVHQELESLQLPWPEKSGHSTLRSVPGISGDDSRPNAGHRHGLEASDRSLLLFSLANSASKTAKRFPNCEELKEQLQAAHAAKDWRLVAELAAKLDQHRKSG